MLRLRTWMRRNLIERSRCSPGPGCGGCLDTRDLTQGEHGVLNGRRGVRGRVRRSDEEPSREGGKNQSCQCQHAHAQSPPDLLDAALSSDGLWAPLLARAVSSGRCC